MSRNEIEVTEILPRIFYLKFYNQEAAASTFLRFQEYYESPNPKFKRHYFTLDQYKKWYIQEMGSFSYYTDWSGFNIPDYVLKPFRDGLFDPLSAKEKQLLSAVASIDRRKPFYVIGTASKKHLPHEMMHALWYLDKSYRKEIAALLKRIPSTFKKQFKNELMSTGYCSDVMDDELQAYLQCGKSWFKDHGIDIAPYADISEALSNVFHQHSK